MNTCATTGRQNTEAGFRVVVFTGPDESQSPPSAIPVDGGRYPSRADARAAGEKRCTELGGYGFWIMDTDFEDAG